MSLDESLLIEEKLCSICSAPAGFYTLFENDVWCSTCSYHFLHSLDIEEEVRSEHRYTVSYS